ncbi:glycosyltransferase family 1 protein [Cellulosimicrobium sp. NPDC055967]|uniref:glycosyltransferase family 1 protein n=1 Tax=Cellulosimicrobium sp. NPDC055967 TaxID=3345670 RepID=UPI0035DB5191
MAESSRRTMLIVSFSPLAGDARVLKQIRHFAASYDVTTCGYGPTPLEGVEHVAIPDDARHELDGRLVTTRVYPLVHRAVPAVRAARRVLAGRRFDVAIANDLETVPVAFDVAEPEHVLADLHEYSPRLHEDNPAWVRRIAPYYRWLARRYAARAGAATTVGDGLARAYRDELGVDCRVVTNAAPYAALSPVPVVEPVRLVHSGACLRKRNLMLLLDAVDASTTPVSLDLFLTPNDPGYLGELRERAARSDREITVHDAVPYDELVATLNRYDIGVHVLPPVNFNNQWALPNKVFDYVQARVALIVGPSPEMAAVVRERGIGLVTEDFSTDALARVLDALTPARVAALKAASDASAHDLASDAQVAVWDEVIAGLARVGTR